MTMSKFCLFDLYSYTEISCKSPSARPRRSGRPSAKKLASVEDQEESFNKDLASEDDDDNSDVEIVEKWVEVSNIMFIT